MNNENRRINTISNYLKDYFGEKTVKLSIDGGFTCPNRDGTKGVGGCIFCSSHGSGDFASNIEDQIQLLSEKWPHAKYIAYFQNYTNTYAPIKKLRKLYYDALSHPKIEGIAIATRPDCISEEAYDLLEEINKNHFMWIELGLQTIHERTASLINRCHSLADYDKALNELTRRNIKSVTHLILGLPGENRDDMIASADYVAHSSSWGIKLHMLNVVKGSQMEVSHPNYSSFETILDYASFVCDILELLPQEMVVHRLTADAMRKILISPPWSYKKRTILNTIHREMERRNARQGDRFTL